MKGRPIDQLVYEYMFTKPRASDPQNFHALLHRHLILEVRQEVHSFYGHLDTQEAKYPGLDYCHPIHRIRLSRWPWHRRLFRAFDGLRLTNSEISNLTKWEGTKWAKERFERDSGIVIRDTADEGMSEWVPPENRPTAAAAASSPSDDQNEEVEAEAEAGDTTENADDDMDGEEDSDGEMESIGIALNQRLLERTARREAGADTSEPLDEEWEQWLKNAIDSGELPFLSNQTMQQQQQSPAFARNPQLVPVSHFLNAARAGQWNAIPPAFRELLRRTVAGESAAAPLLEPASLAPRSAVPSQQSAPWRRTVSNLRLPVGEGSSSSSNASSETVRLNRTAQPNA